MTSMIPPPPSSAFLDLIMFPELAGRDGNANTSNPQRSWSERQEAFGQFVGTIHDQPGWSIIAVSLFMLFIGGKTLEVMGVVDAYSLPGGLVVAFLSGVWVRRFLSTPRSTGMAARSQRAILRLGPFLVGFLLTAFLLSPLDDSTLKSIVCYLGGGILAFGDQRSLGDLCARSRAR